MWEKWEDRGVGVRVEGEYWGGGGSEVQCIFLRKIRRI